MNVYLASPERCLYKGTETKKVAEWIKSIYPNTNIYCPQDYYRTIPCWKYPYPELDFAKQLFDKNLKHLEVADLVVCVYSDIQIVSAAWEVGYAQAKNKEVWLIVPSYQYEKTSLMFITANKVFSPAGPENEITEINQDKFKWK